MPEIYSVHFNLPVSLLSPPFLVFSLFFFLRRSRRPIFPFVRPRRTSFPSLDFFQLVPKILSDASGYHEHRPRFQSGFPRTRCNNLVSPYFRPRYSLTVVRVHLLVAVCSDSAAWGFSSWQSCFYLGPHFVPVYLDDRFNPCIYVIRLHNSVLLTEEIKIRWSLDAVRCIDQFRFSTV